jgi:hypothetical protein
MVILPDMIVEIPQATKYFELERHSEEVQTALRQQLPTIFIALVAQLLTLGLSWVICCKKLGGLLFFYLKLLSMLTWTMALTGLMVHLVL